MAKQIGNQWAYLKGYSVNFDQIDVTEGSDYVKRYMRGRGLITFTGIAPYTPEIRNAMDKWIGNVPPHLPNYTEEWLCLYCGSPNPLPATHCSQCGAPRNWLIG